MRQEVGYDKLRIGRIVADAHVDRLAVFERDHAVQLERNGDPLVFLYAAVVMGLEIRKLVAFVKRILLEVDARRIDMRTGDNAAFLKAFPADDGEHKSL